MFIEVKEDYNPLLLLSFVLSVLTTDNNSNILKYRGDIMKDLDKIFNETLKSCKDSVKDYINICVVYSHDPCHDFEHTHVVYFESKEDYFLCISDLEKYQVHKGTEYCIYLPFSWLKNQLVKLESQLLFDLKKYDGDELKKRLETYNKGVSNMADGFNRLICQYVQGGFKYDEEF